MIHDIALEYGSARRAHLADSGIDCPPRRSADFRAKAGSENDPAFFIHISVDNPQCMDVDRSE